jgi:hypothetical protein
VLPPEIVFSDYTRCVAVASPQGLKPGEFCAVNAEPEGSAYLRPKSKGGSLLLE